MIFPGFDCARGIMRQGHHDTLPPLGATREEAAMSPLTAWDNFYVIMGSSAGALTGLTFVVFTLQAGRRERDAINWGVATFNTPTVVYFGTVLLVSAILSAPWSSLSQAALLLGFCGLGGVAYGAIVVRRLRRRIGYDPVREDWLWFAVLPLAASTALVVTALMLPGRPALALFGIGAVLLLLLFVGIHNAWDVVTYMAIDRLNQEDGQEDERSAQEE